MTVQSRSSRHEGRGWLQEGDVIQPIFSRCASTRNSPFLATANARIISRMSPTVFREAGFRFYFFSREETRMHVHVQGQNGEAKFWLEPAIELAQYVGLVQREISEALRLVKEHENDIRSAWYRHFPG